MENVFVYGTLRKGGFYHHLLKDSKFISHGFIYGDMYSLGRYPAVVLSENSSKKVFGEIFCVTSDVLATLDRLEEYPDLYERGMYEIETEDHGVVEAWVYFLNEDDIRDECEVVVSGDWFEFVGV